MNGEVKQKWIDALEGGEYKQGQSYLHQGYTYCCLGVLADLYLKEKGEHWVESHPTESGRVYAVLEDHNYKQQLCLPRQVRDWAEVDSMDPEVNGIALSSLNDGRGLNFREIAQEIREHL